MLRRPFLLILAIIFLVLPISSALTDEEINGLYNSLILYSTQDSDCNSDSLSATTGTVVGTPTNQDIALDVQGSCDYDQSDAIVWEIGSTTLENVINFTFVMWTNEQNSDTAIKTIARRSLAAGYTGTSRWGWEKTNGVDQFGVVYYCDSDAAQSYPVVASIRANTGFKLLSFWINVVDNGVTMRFYHNSTSVADGSCSTGAAAYAGDLYINERQDASNKGLADRDEIMFFNKSLTTDELAYLVEIFSAEQHLEAVGGGGDVTPPTSDSTSINNTTPKINEDIQFSGQCTDETGLSSQWIAHNISGTLINVTSINLTTETTNNFSINFTNTLTRGNVVALQMTCNDTSGNPIQSSEIEYIVANTPVPAPTSINWKTTGGLTTGTRTYNEIIDWVNATCTADADNDFSSCNLTVTDPDGVVIANNLTMGAVQNDVYSYGTDFTLNKAGTWTLTVLATDGASISTATDTITVQTQNLTTIDGWYGYTEHGILTSGIIDLLLPYEYAIYELTINSTALQDDWTSLLASINYSNYQNIRVGVNIIMDFNYSVDGEKNGFYANITANFSDLNLDPYEDTIEYISLEINNASEYTEGDKYGTLNNASVYITSATGNKFVVYSRNYPSADLDVSYIQNTSMNYLTPETHYEWIFVENELMRNTTSLNRIYDNINGSLKTDVKDFWDNTIDILRGTPDPTTTVGNKSVAELSNGDFVVFNIYDDNRLLFLNFSNVSDSAIIGKDIWDYTNKIYVHSNTNGTGEINVSAYSTTVVFIDDYDHIESGWTLFKASSNGQLAFNYTDGTNEGNWILDNDADEIRIELFDPHYQLNSFITYYGWFNASYINNWSNYEIIIFDDENRDIVQQVMNNATNTDLFCYISVADFDNTGAWQSGKEAEVDACLALNPSSDKLNVFVDGLDTGVGGTNFSSRFKDLADYVKITKGRKVGLNTYTAYEDFCSYSAPNGFCMKESCVRRWNGASSANPDSYTLENWDLELNKSSWYQSHNVRVLCQAFDNRTTDTFEPKNWTIVQDTYFASKVLGYDDFYISQPDFNYAHTIYLYDVGTDLAQSWSTDDNETYYRRFSEGIVYFNKTNEKGWIDDGRETDVQVCFDLYDNSDGAGDEERDFEFRVNNVTTTDDYQYTIPATEITAGVWQWYCVKLNESDESTTGSYKIEASTTNGGQVADGIYIGWQNAPARGKHSWYSDIAGSPVWNAYPIDQNWEVMLMINETKKASIDTFSDKIVQTEASDAGKTNITLSSNNPFEIEIWSEPVTVDKFINLSYWDGSTFQRVYPINTSTCTSNHPDWNSTTINGEVHKSCIETVGDTTQLRIATPHLSTQIYQVDFNNPPIVNMVQPQENSLYNLQPFGINYTFSDTDGDEITQVRIYINGTINQTISGNTNTTLNASDGKYTISVMAYDGFNWGANTTILSFKIDTINPVDNMLVTIPEPTYINKDHNYTIQASDSNLFGHNVTVYAPNGSIMFSQEVINIAGTTNDIRIQANISWGDGNYTFYSNESDDHTDEDFKAKSKEKDVDKKEAKVDDAIITEISNNKLDDITFIEKPDRVSIIFDFSKSNEKDKKYTYIFSIKYNSKVTYREFSKYEGHFVLGNGLGELWVDNEFKNNEDADYKIKKISDTEYQVEITTSEVYLEFESIGGVNKGSSEKHIVIDTTNPAISSLSNKTVDDNTTNIYTNDNVKLSFFVVDLHLQYVNISHNVTGDWVNESISTTQNDTYYYTINQNNLSVDKAVSWYAISSDKVGNMEISPQSTFSVNGLPSSGGGSSEGGGSSNALISLDGFESPFGNEPENGTCKPNEQMLDGRCYPCDPTKGYLEFNPEDRSVRCILCNDGYTLSGKECVLEKPNSITKLISQKIDWLASKISSLLSVNVILGYFIILSASMLLIYSIIKPRVKIKK